MNATFYEIYGVTTYLASTTAASTEYSLIRRSITHKFRKTFKLYGKYKIVFGVFQSILRKADWICFQLGIEGEQENSNNFFFKAAFFASTSHAL